MRSTLKEDLDKVVERFEKGITTRYEFLQEEEFIEQNALKKGTSQDYYEYIREALKVKEIL